MNDEIFKILYKFAIDSGHNSNISHFSQITCLDFTKTSNELGNFVLKHFQRFTPFLPNLQEIYLSGWSLSENYQKGNLSDGLTQLSTPTLELLDISNTGLDSIPSDLVKFFLFRLKSLNLSFNYLDDSISALFCQELLKIPQKNSTLQDVRLRGNGDISYIPDFFQLSGSKFFPNLQVLDLSQTRIDEIVFARGLSSLEELHLTQTSASQSLEGLKRLPHFKSLIISDNFLNRIPEYLTETPNLQYLDLSKNNLDNQSNLQILENLNYLRVLDISDNNLVEFPKIQNLTNLQFLSLNNNQVYEIPPDLLEWYPNIRRVSLQSTNVSYEDIPEELLDLYASDKLDFLID